MTGKEHVQYPFVTTSEILRILRPGGRLIGTVGTLNPVPSG